MNVEPWKLPKAQKAALELLAQKGGIEQVFAKSRYPITLTNKGRVTVANSTLRALEAAGLATYSTRTDGGAHRKFWCLTPGGRRRPPEHGVHEDQRRQGEHRKVRAQDARPQAPAGPSRGHQGLTRRAAVGEEAIARRDGDLGRPGAATGLPEDRISNGLRGRSLLGDRGGRARYLWTVQEGGGHMTKECRDALAVVGALITGSLAVDIYKAAGSPMWEAVVHGAVSLVFFLIFARLVLWLYSGED